MTEAERLALITHEQVGLVLQEAELVELATLEAEERAFNLSREAQRRPQTVHIDWMTGSRMSADIIPFPGRNKSEIR
jgi:hypothetical protein